MAGYYLKCCEFSCYRCEFFSWYLDLRNMIKYNMNRKSQILQHDWTQGAWQEIWQNYDLTQELSHQNISQQDYEFDQICEEIFQLFDSQQNRHISACTKKGYWGSTPYASLVHFVTFLWHDSNVNFLTHRLNHWHKDRRLFFVSLT